MAFSCDVIDTSGAHPEWHIKQDVLPLLNGYCVFTTGDGKEHKLEQKWDLIIAHPPCTYLASTGFPYYNVEKYGQKAIQRAQYREKAFNFFMAIVNADCDKIAIENPVGYINSHYRKPNQIIHPWQFGENYTKKTCLWLKGLKELEPVVKEQPENCISYACATMIDENGVTISWSSKKSKKLRSKTFIGIAEAMANQWG